MAAKPLFDTEHLHEAKIEDLIPVVNGGIVSKALIDTGPVKQILFSMDAGQEISSHKAPFAATVQMLDGVVDFEVEGRTRLMRTNDWLLMPPNAPHSLKAITASRFLLTLIKESSTQKPSESRQTCSCG